MERACASLIAINYIIIDHNIGFCSSVKNNIEAFIIFNINTLRYKIILNKLFIKVWRTNNGKDNKKKL